MIKIKKINKTWKKDKFNLSAIEDVSFSVKKGEFVSIIGPSGCGKTTLLKIIVGLIKPSSGSVIINNGRLTRNALKKIAIVFQNPALLSWRNVSENVKLPIELGVNTGFEKVENNISLVGLDDFKNHYPHELSGGMQQRVSIARSLVINPSLLLMDEPFGALDEITRNNLNEELIKVWDKKKSTIIFVTHSIPEAVYLSDKIIVLSDRPSKVKDIIEINLSRPRLESIKETDEFQKVVKCIKNKLKQ